MNVEPQAMAPCANMQISADSNTTTADSRQQRNNDEAPCVQIDHQDGETSARNATRSSRAKRGLKQERLHPYIDECRRVKERKDRAVAKLEGWAPDGKFSKLMPVEYIPRAYTRRTDVSCEKTVVTRPNNWSVTWIIKLDAAIVAARGDRTKFLRKMRSAVKLRHEVKVGPNELIVQDLNKVVEWLT